MRTKFLMIPILVAFIAAIAAFSQTPELAGSGRSPGDVVMLWWILGTRGELLATDGWKKASQILYTKPVPSSGSKIIFVVGNEYSLPSAKISGKNAEVEIAFGEAGQIDAQLRYTPAKPDYSPKTVKYYRLVYIQTPLIQFTQHKDGKIEKKEMPGPMEWQIDSIPEPPWTTVNTAIRYVLERRGKTTDPVIKKNADQTVARLLKLR